MEIEVEGFLANEFFTSSPKLKQKENRRAAINGCLSPTLDLSSPDNPQSYPLALSYPESLSLFGSSISIEEFNSLPHTPYNVISSGSVQTVLSSTSEMLKELDIALKNEYFSVSSIREQFVEGLPLSLSLLLCSKWVNQRLWLVFSDSEGKQYYVLGSKRGNPVYCYNLSSRLNEFQTVFNGVPDFFNPYDRHHVQKTNLLFVSLTVNPSLYSVEGSWLNIRDCENNFLSALRRYLKSRYNSSQVNVLFSVVEAQVSGYAHLHMVLMVEPGLKVFYRKGKWRCVNKRDLEKYWHMGLMDIEACPSFSEASKYASKYQTKYFSQSFSPPDNISSLLSLSSEERKSLSERDKTSLKAFQTLTFAILLNVRSFSFSPKLSEIKDQIYDKTDLINAEMSNSNNKNNEWFFIGIFFENEPKDWGSPIQNNKNLTFLDWNDSDPPPFFYKILDYSDIVSRGYYKKSKVQRLLETPFFLLSEVDKRYIKKHSKAYFTGLSTISPEVVS